MFLQKLEIQGFKSFAPKSTFTFPSGNNAQKSIAAIVGPNGSGKSNIADAIRWVLGEQSLKNLRSRKSEDVIFFGSDKKSQLGSCEVSLLFNNEDHRLPLEYSEIVITRRLYRNGESEYYLNKNRVRLSDITLLMAQAHVGQKSYSVIGQGMADGIINASPSERKEFFDEAAGVRQYQIKKDQAASKLKSTEENIKQTEVFLAELEPKLKFFQRQMKRLEQREDLEKKLYELSISYYATQWNILSKNIIRVTDRHKEIQKELLQHEHEYEKLQKDFSSREGGSEKNEHSNFCALKQKYDGFFSQKQSLAADLTVLEGRLRLSLEKEGKSDIAWLIKQKQEVSQTLELLKQTHALLLNESTQSEESEKTAKQALEKLDNEIKQLQSVLGEKNEQIKIISPEEVVQELQELATVSKEYHGDDVSFEILKEGFSRLVERIHMLIGKVRDSSNHKDVDSADEKERLKKLHQEREDFFHTYIELKAAVQIKQEIVRSHNQEIKKKEEEKRRLEQELAYFDASTKGEQKDLLHKEKKQLENSSAEVTKNLNEAHQSLSLYYEREKESQRELLELQKNLNRKQRETEEIKKQDTEIRLELTKYTTHQEDLLRTITQNIKMDDSLQQELSDGRETVDSVFGFSVTPSVASLDETRRDIERLRSTLEQIGTIDQEALREYDSTKERYEFLTTQLTDLRQAVETLTKALAELDDVIKERFDISLSDINEKFEEYFKHLFNGGSARLLIQKKEVEQDSGDDPERLSRDEDENTNEEVISGIEIQATPPGKKLKSVSFLSGGEKAMTSIALLCAILSVNPSPFVVLDEVDAALDESNAVRFASIIRDLSSQTQFILITHNRATIHTGDVLYGITMGEDGISHALSLDIQKAHDTLS